MASFYRCELVAHDYLFFTAFGTRDTSMNDYIGNYALMYAINTQINCVHRNASGTKPFYTDDLKHFTLYATPAKPLPTSVISPSSGNKWNRWERVSHTFNSVNTLTQTTEQGGKANLSRVGAKVNLPQVGAKEKFAPLNAFEFFVIGGSPPCVIRLGKKHASCRVFAYPLTLEKVSSGVFEACHPVNPMDAPGNFKLVYGDYKLQFPPLILNARLEGEHYVLKDGEKTYRVLKPSSKVYENVEL